MDIYGGGVSLFRKVFIWVLGKVPPETPGQLVKIAMVIQDTLLAFKVAAPQITGCDILFVKLDSRDQLEMLVLYQPPLLHHSFSTRVVQFLWSDWQ